MALISKPIALFDVGNCEGVMQRAIDKSTIRYDAGEREELLAEGWALLFELAERYKPLPEPPCGYAAWFAMTLGDRQDYEHRLRAETKTKRGCFSGHAAMFLPRRLGDAWHKSHPEHLYITDPDSGKRGWFYGQAMVSLNSITDSAGGEMAGEAQLLHARPMTAFCQMATLCLASSGL